MIESGLPSDSSCSLAGYLLCIHKPPDHLYDTNTSVDLGDNPRRYSNARDRVIVRRAISDGNVDSKVPKPECARQIKVVAVSFQLPAGRFHLESTTWVDQ